MKNILDGNNGRIDIVEENISELENIEIETIENEPEKEKENQK